jgi:hypothetical protein
MNISSEVTRLCLVSHLCHDLFYSRTLTKLYSHKLYDLFGKYCYHKYLRMQDYTGNHELTSSGRN